MKENVLQKIRTWANWKGVLLFFALEIVLNVLLLHAMTFAHLSGSVAPLRPIFNRGPHPTGGNWNTVNSGVYCPDKPYAMGLGPAYRVISDLADWDNSRSIIPTGQSGHPFSSHCDDQIEPWLAVTYHPLPFTQAAIERAAMHNLFLNPAP